MRKTILWALLTGCAGIGLAAIALWCDGVCSWVMAAMVVLGMGCCVFVCLHELAVQRAYEARQAEAARRSAWREAFFREVDKPV